MSPFESSARSHPSFFAVRIVLIGLLTAAAAGLLLLARQSGAYAAPSCDKTWTGAISSSWTASGNWSPSGQPSSTQYACITSGTNQPTIATATNITIAGMQLDSMTLTINGTGTLTLADSSGTKSSQMTSGTVQGSGTMTVGSGHVFNWTGGTMQGTGSTVVAASGTLAMDASAQPSYLGLDQRTLTNNGAITYKPSASGPGGQSLYLGFACSGNPTTIANNGTFTYNGQNAGDAGIGSQCATNTITNNGTFTKSAGTGTAPIAPDLDNNGAIAVQTGTLQFNGAFPAYDSGTKTLTKGTYNVTGTLQFPNADVVRNGATIVLDGAGSAIQWTTGTNALANFASNSGSLTVKNGKALATKAFTNTGTVVIGPGSNSSLTSPGSGYTQSGGGSSTALTAASSKLASSAASGNVTINGGILSGIGTVQTAGGQSLVNVAAVSPGTSPGILSATANYSQSAGGSLPIQIGGTTVGTQYDRLAVTGNASLNGSLDLSTINGFTPSAGQSFTILTYTGTRTGTFSAITGDTLCSIGIHYQVVYDDAGKQVRLDAKLAPPVVTGYSKAAQAVGKKITVLGSCFTGATQVAFTKAGGGTVNGTGMQVLSDTQISVKVPNLAATGPVSVTGPGGTGIGPILKIKATILDFNPKSGPVGTQVILTGTAFTGVSKVLFGTTKAVFTLDSDGQITTSAPAGAITAVITITTPGGKAKTKVVFTVT